MKDQQEPERPRKRALVGRNEYPPFKRNQLRWALHCYRWKEGISWEKYPYVIASALGMKDLREGLNSRDPRGFVLEGQTPTPEKLRLYERFIQNAAPTYAKALTEEGLAGTFSDLAGRYLNSDWEKAAIDGSLVNAAESIEPMAFVGPHPGTGYPGVYEYRFLTFRRMGDSPNLHVRSFTMDLRDVVYKCHDEFGPYTPDCGKSEDTWSYERDQFTFERVLALSFDDLISFTEYMTGVAVPFAEGQSYLVVLKDLLTNANVAQLCPCEVTVSMSSESWDIRHHERRPDSDHISVTFALFKTFDKQSIHDPAYSWLMGGADSPAIQAFVAAMR